MKRLNELTINMEYTFRKRIFDLVESENHTILNRLYDSLMLVCIVLSLIPLAFREENIYFLLMDKISVVFFIIDYLFRWMTADYKMPQMPRWKAFLIYPFTPFAIIDLLSILPSLMFFHRAFKLLRISRLLKILRVFRFVRYSKSIKVLGNVIRREKKILFTVFLIAVGYIFLTALIMFNVEESESFDNFFDALYWATISLTTVGYGDICPKTEIGRLISMFSAIFGVAIIALPSGVITASYMSELKEQQEKQAESQLPENQQENL